jgi:hypothetical protein
LAQEIIRQATEGTVDSERFTAETLTRIKDRIAQVSQNLKALGPLNGIELLERGEQAAGRLYRYRLKYKDRNVFLVMGLNQDGKITRLNLQPE